MAAQPSARRDGPRRAPAGAAVLQQDVTDAIVDAVFVELAEVGYGRLSMEAVAKRAGVGKTAVYRRWPSKQAMVVALVSQVAVTAIAVPDTGNLRDDVKEYLENASEALDHPLARTIIPDLFAEAARNPALIADLSSTVRDPRRERAATVVRRGIARGELAPDTDLELALDFLAGPLYWRLTIIRSPREEDYFDRLADKIVAAMKA
jgi:AcrR family transcriptional regulator